MIAATGLELRAGAQLLLGGATFQISPGDKVGLVGRNGAGKTTLARVLAGDGLPAAGTVQRSGTIGYLPQDSRAGDLAALAMDRVLSARGLDEVRAGMRTAEEAMGDPSPERRDAAVRRYSTLEERLVVLGGYAAEAEAAAIASSLGLPDRVLVQPLQHALGRAAAPGGAGADPVLGRADTAARRAHQPPGRRLHRLAARPPPHVPRLRGDHQPRPGAAGGGGRPDLPPRRRPRRTRHLQRRLAGVPGAARDRRPAAQAGGGERPAPGGRPAGAGGQDAGEGHQGPGRPGHGAPGAAAAGRGERGTSCGPGRAAALPGARPMRQDAADRRGPVEVLRLAGGLRRGGRGGGPGRPDRGPGAQRGGQDHPAAPAERAGTARHRAGDARPRAAPRLLRAGARDAGRRAHRAGEHAVGRAGAARWRAPGHPRVLPLLRRRGRQARRGPVRR